MEAIIGIALFIGLCAAFVYVIDSLGVLRKGQAEILEKLARLEQNRESR